VRMLWPWYPSVKSVCMERLRLNCTTTALLRTALLLAQL